MKSKFLLSCGSTVDLPYSYMQERGIPVIFYTYSIDGKEYVDDMSRDPRALPEFYKFLAAGKLPSTSQINISRYYDFFEEQLKQGDLMYIAFGSGMSSSVNNAQKAAEMLREKYTERKIIVIDSLCSSSGYGLLVDEAADMRDRGCSMDETEQWVLENRKKVHHQFFSVDLKYYRRSGRMSGAAATIGSVLNICPIMRLDDAGRIIAYDKVRGRNNAIQETIRTMERNAKDGLNYSGKCWICNSDCLREAEQLKYALKERFRYIRGEIRICDIGTIIAAHCGPGTVAVFFFGDERAPYVTAKE
jgi:DegV family protein with EDD domain